MSDVVTQSISESLLAFEHPNHSQETSDASVSVQTEEVDVSEQADEAASLYVTETDTPEIAEPMKMDHAVAEPVAAEPVRQNADTPEVVEPSGFRKLDLSEEVQLAIEDSGYSQPTEIQAQIIPHVLDGRDVIAQSQTGTGKTAAFALPVLSRIKSGLRKPQVLVLAPTRELAMQVAASFSTYGRQIPNFSVAAVYGGQGYDSQLRLLKRGVPVIVGTPGRVIDHIKRGTMDLSELDCLVLDEADEMLNMGFLEDVKFVLEQTPKTRQVALFSATLPAPIRKIAQQYLNDPVHITVKQKTMTASAIRQRAVIVQQRDKLEVLARFLEAEETDGVIVFTKTREATVTVADYLSSEGFSSVALNGDMAQNVRERTIAQLKSGKLDVLVATDVAARGLDVSRISHVFNYDLPQDTESYVHRIGRTGRAGRNGEAIVMVSGSQRYKLRQIERVTKQSIEVIPPPTAEQINTARVARFKQQISETIDSQDLSMFAQIITDYASESEQPLEKIAAALAVLSQKGRRFFVEDRPQRNGSHRFAEQDDRGRRDRSDSFEQRDNRFSNDRNQRPQRGDRRPNTVQGGLDRYRIEVGHDDGVKPGNIVGAIANEAGIEGQYIGPINIYDSYSTIDLPEGMPREIHETLQDVRVAGKALRLRRASASDTQSGNGFRKGGPRKGGKPGFNKRFSGKAKTHGKPKFGGRRHDR